MSEDLMLNYALEHRFPHPVAAPFRNARTATGGPDRAAFHLAAVDGLVRYLGCILLSDYFSKAPAQDKAARAEEYLLYPTPKRWAELVLELAGQLAGRGPFIPELCGALVGRNGKPTQTGNSLLTLAETAADLLANKELLVDAVKSGETADLLSESLNEVVRPLLFLQNNPLVVFRSHATPAESSGFQGFMMRWMGCRAQPLPVGIDFEGTVPQGQVLLLSLDGDKGLELSPFMAVASGQPHQAEGFYMASGLRNRNTLRLESFATGRFITRALTGKDGPLTLAEHMLSWGDGGRLARLAPTDGSASRLKFQSKLLPSEKVLEGRYQTLGFVGRGGIGAVYQVHDLEEKSDKAVKILYPDLSRNEFFTRYFLETGSMLARLSHRNLVPVYEAGYSSTLQENHIVMKYMRGGSLAELLERRETLPPRECIRVALSVLEALHHLHENNLLHGGIHPGNILKDESGTWCLGDFGILRLPSSRVAAFRPLERLHSLRYASPELLLGGQASPASDLYSLSIVLYEMLTGQVPSKTEFVPPSELIFPIPDALDQVLEKALAYDARDRHANAMELFAALGGIESEMGSEYQVSTVAQAQQLLGHLGDVHFGSLESVDRDFSEAMAKGDFEGAARLLQVRVEEVWDVEEKVYWMQQLAQLYFEKLDMPGKAVSIYRDCLELAPDNPVATRAIMGHFERTGQWDELAEILDELRQGTENDPLVADYLRRLVDVYRDKLKEPGRAAEYLELLVEKTGAKPEWIELLVRLKEEVQDWAGAARALEKWHELAASPAERAGLLRRLATVYQDELDSPDAAVRVWEQLLALEPSDKGAMQALRKLYRAQFSYGRLTDLLKKMIQGGVPEQGELVELYQELGEMLSSYVYDSRSALSVWTELLRISPSNQTALSYLERLYLREGQNDKYIGVLEAKAEVTADPAEKAGVLLSAALARVEFLSDIAGARTLLEQGLSLAPRHSGIEAALERLYDQHQDVEAQSRLHLSRLEREQDPAVRLDILWKLSGLFEKSGEPAQASLEVMKRALAEAMSDPAVRVEVERLAEKAGSWDDLVAFYVEQLARTQPGTEERNYIAGRLAFHTLHSLPDRAKGIFALTESARLAPDSEPILRALLSVYREQEKWGDLAGTLLSYVPKAEEARRPELFEEAVLLVKNRLTGTQEGRRLVGRLVEMSSSFTGTPGNWALVEVCRMEEDHASLIEVAQRELDKEMDPLRAQNLRLDLGEAAMRMKDPGRARIWLEAALEKAPHDSDVQQALQDALAMAEDWAGLLRLYRRLIPVTEDTPVKLGYLEKAAQIELTVFNRVENAIELFRQLVAEAPRKIEYVQSLADALTRAERFTELAWLYEQNSQHLKGDDRRGMLLALASLYEERLSNPDAAILALRQVLRQAPDDNEVFERARSLCLSEKRFDTLLKLLAERSRSAPYEERLRLMVEMARLSAMEMGLLPPAKSYLDEVLREEPGHEGAFELYRQILERQEDWRGLAALMESQFARVEDERKRVEIGLHAARLLVERLDHKVRACEILEKVWELDPKNTGAPLSLVELYASQSRWDRAASMLTLLHSGEADLFPEERARLAFLTGLTHEALLRRPQAIEAFRVALDSGYRADEAREKLATLLYMQESYEEARTFLTAVLDGGRVGGDRARDLKAMLADVDRKLGRMDRSREHLEALLAQSPGDKENLRKLMEVCRADGDREAEARYLRQYLEVETDPDKRFPLLVGLGDLAKEMPGRQEEAIAAYEKAFAINPTSRGVIISLGQLLLEAGRFEGAARAFREAENLETDPRRKAAFALTQGVLFIEKAGNPEQAAIHLRRCLELDVSKMDAFTMLEKILVERTDWDGQKELYTFMLGKVGDKAASELLFRLHLNLGRILLEKFSDTKGALDHLEQAAELNPEDAEVNELKAGIYMQSEGGMERALEEYRKLTQDDPHDANLVRAFRKTSSLMKRFDEAWYASAILDLLGAASVKEKAFLQKFSSAALKIKPKVVDVDRFRSDLVAFEEDWELTEIIRILFERMSGKLSLASPKSMGFGKAQLVDEEKAPMVVKMVEVVAKVLGIPAPQMYLRETATGVLKEGCYPATLVAGNDFIEARKGKELRFELARTLALFVPHHMAVGLIDRDNLRLLLSNLLKLAVPGFPEPAGDPRANADLRRDMEKAIPAAEMGRVRELILSLKNKGGEMSVKRWLIGIEKTSCRFGLLFANDLHVAVNLVKASPVQLSAASREEIVDDLLSYSVSEPFARLRTYLGISVV